MKRLALFLLVMTLTGAGVSYAETNNPIQNFFLGNQNLSGEGFNQVLSLLVGPQGQAGPAGVRGRDGAAGLNGRDGAAGLNGRDGAPGAPGSAGADGKSVVVVQLAAGSTSCPNGGVQLTDGSGLITFVCNGAKGDAGARGPSGPQGATGPAGTGGSGGSSGSTTTFNGNAQISLGTCDDFITISLPSIFVANGFSLLEVNISGLSYRCNNQLMSVSLPIRTSVPPVGSNPTPIYSFNSGVNRDFVDCVTGRLSLANREDNTLNLSTQNRSFANFVPLSCTLRRTGASITFEQIYTADIDTNIGLQVGS